MAKTYTFADAINLVKKNQAFRQLEDASFARFAVDEANRLMWGDFDWRESLAQLTPFYMTPGESDIVSPAIALPTDIWGFRDVWIRQIFGSNYPLKVLQSLPISGFESRPTSIMLLQDRTGVRLHPTPASGYGAPYFQIEGWYKKLPTKVLQTGLNSTLPYEDNFFSVFVEALRYQYLTLLGLDGGQVVYSAGRSQYTGQLAKYKAMLTERIGQENIDKGGVQIAPEESLSYGGEW